MSGTRASPGSNAVQLVEKLTPHASMSTGSVDGAAAEVARQLDELALVVDGDDEAVLFT